MEFVDAYISDENTAKHMVALCSFLNNGKIMAIDPLAKKRAETYLSKRRMHGVLNIWPFNALKFENSIDPTQEWTVDDVYNSIVDNRDVLAFVQAFAEIIEVNKRMHKTKLEIAKTEVELYSCDGWWEGVSTSRPKDLIKDIRRSEVLVKSLQQANVEARKECNRLLFKVLKRESAIEVIDRDGEVFVPETISLSSMRRTSK